MIPRSGWPAAIVGLAVMACSVRPVGSNAPVQTPAVAAPPPGGPAGVATVAKTPDSAVGPEQFAVPLSYDQGVVRSMIAEGTERSRVGANLQYLSDVVGPRLTGSAALRLANEWTMHQFRSYGADSAWLEEWTFGQGWERGPLVLEMTAPHRQELYGVSWAWAPGTNGPVTGNVVLVTATSMNDFARYQGTLRGAWVMTREPLPLRNPDVPVSAADSSRADSILRATLTLTDAQRKFRAQLPSLLAREGAAGILTDGAKDFALLTMSGSPRQLYPLANIVIPHETYAMFGRILASGTVVTLRADITNTLTTDTLAAYNTVAEIRGREHPDQVVLLGAHLDSWDLAQGATDNGAGAIAVLEAARILAAAKVRPARTIRFVLFTGEEEGLLGSEAYVEDHVSEMVKFQAVLVLDNGTGRIKGMALQGRDELHAMWDSLFVPLSPLGAFAIRSASKGGTDHLSFLPFGVPGFNYDQETRGYNHTHHSQVDTYDHVVPGDLAQAATVMAINAYELANSKILLPRGEGTPTQ
jgi:carboxypeptidase Q